MSVRWSRKARDGSSGSTDWTTIGARILQVARMAEAVHRLEQAELVSRNGRAAWALATVGGQEARMPFGVDSREA